MTAHLRTASGLQTVSKLRVRTASGLQVVNRAWIRTASGLQQFYSAVTTTVSPTYVSGYGASNSPIYVTSGSVTIFGVPAGATISWTVVPVSGSGIVAVSPTLSSTTFRAQVASGVTKTATAYATVNGVNTNGVSIELTNGGIA